MKLFRIFIITFIFTALKIVIISVCFLAAIYISPPCSDDPGLTSLSRNEAGKDFYVCKNNWLRHSESGLWELYVEGEAFERGVITGILTKDLIDHQEKAFISEIKRLIPSESYMNFLKYFVAWFNRNIDKHIIPEYQLEIYGISKAASDEYSEIGPSYLRFLNYHAAHDIGHTLQNIGIVGCTSFATWNDAGEDSILVIGRNFDFYVGDDFSEEKIVAFYRPEKGYRFAFVTWGGMIGVVSGMNEKGLTVTLNAAISDIPFEAKTPVSLLAREILQYAQNIEEAIQIAERRETFVSESFLIGSAQDNKAVVIEKSSDTLSVFESPVHSLVCTNHYQSSFFEKNKNNIRSIATTSSPYRQKRVEELIMQKQPINYIKAAEILRDQRGLDGKNIGMANEKAINQLIAHHSVIFMPSELKMWVSTNPYQLGKYVAYDLNKVFNTDVINSKNNTELYLQQLTIPADTFLFSPDYIKFETYRKIKSILSELIKRPWIKEIQPDVIDSFISLNPGYFFVYSLAGDYYMSRNIYNKAEQYYKMALEKEITTSDDVRHIKEKLLKCKTE